MDQPTIEVEMAWAPPCELPAVLAELHREAQPEAPVRLDLIDDGAGDGWRRNGDSVTLLRAMLDGAGLAVESIRVDRRTEGGCRIRCRVRRAFTLPDTVGPSMRLLICGLNPSIYSADVGVGFARPGNRFWPAAMAAGLVTRDRDPHRALRHDGVGMTDLVKRATRRADELTAVEYSAGLDRLDRLAGWLRPRAVCFVGLAGWRSAVDRRAVTGPQSRSVGERPVYLMPSTSGLNAHSRPADLVEHFRRAADLADHASR